MEITKYVAKMNSFNKILRCENHRKEVINMACKKCYRYNCLQCDEECTTTTCNGKYLQCVSFYSSIFPIRTDYSITSNAPQNHCQSLSTHGSRLKNTDDVTAALNADALG